MSTRMSAGLVGGLVAGVVFGVMMHAWDMIAMIGALVGSEGVVMGWIVHLVISAAIGVGYAVTFGALEPGYVSSTIYGLIYGAAWWVLGPLLLMPVFLGMEPFPAIEQQQVQSLIGHLTYGLVVGVVYVAVRDRSRQQHATHVERERDTRVHA